VFKIKFKINLIGFNLNDKAGGGFGILLEGNHEAAKAAPRLRGEYIDRREFSRFRRRPHQALGYEVPVEYHYKHQKVSPMYPSSTLI
jgi:transposase InsO family protein